jgi:hypothetical protein
MQPVRTAYQVSKTRRRQPAANGRTYQLFIPKFLFSETSNPRSLRFFDGSVQKYVTEKKGKNDAGVRSLSKQKQKKKSVLDFGRTPLPFFDKLKFFP